MIIAWVEQEENQLTEASLQMLTLARETAVDTGGEPVALVIGACSADLAAALGRYGMSRIIQVRHEGLDAYAPAAWAAAALQVATAQAPQVIMAPATDRGGEVMAHLAAKAGLPLAANCASLAPGDPFRVTRLRWGSSLLEEAVLEGTPKLLTVALHVKVPEAAARALEAAVEPFDATVEDKDRRVRLTRRQAEVAEGVTLKTAPVVIGGGRGVGSPEGYAVLEELAALLGGAVGCSRVATNNGWRPHSDQVGLTGTRISPELYIACGISGAIQHLVGCKGSKRIMVINKDPEAAFFDKADYGVIGDLQEILPAIVQELKVRKTA